MRGRSRCKAAAAGGGAGGWGGPAPFPPRRMRTSCVGVEPSRDGPCAREPRGRAAPAPRPPPSAAAWHLERPLILEGDRQDRVALVEDHRVRPADQGAQGPVGVGEAYVALAEGDAALRRF